MPINTHKIKIIHVPPGNDVDSSEAASHILHILDAKQLRNHCDGWYFVCSVQQICNFQNVLKQ